MPDEHDRLHAALTLIGQRGVLEVLAYLRRHSVATMADLKTAGITRPDLPLRGLAVAGCVRRIGAGSWDQRPAADDLFTCTPRGVELAELTTQMHHWGRRHFDHGEHRRVRRWP